MSEKSDQVNIQVQKLQEIHETLEPTTVEAKTMIESLKIGQLHEEIQTFLKENGVTIEMMKAHYTFYFGQNHSINDVLQGHSPLSLAVALGNTRVAALIREAGGEMPPKHRRCCFLPGFSKKEGDQDREFWEKVMSSLKPPLVITSEEEVNRPAP